MPPKKPASLKHYLAMLARNIGVNRYTFNKAAKRNQQTEEFLDEIALFTPTDGPEEMIDASNLRDTINHFLEIQEKDTRICFVLRYFYSMTNKEIAEKIGKKEHTVTALLSNVRKRLKEYLISQGYSC